MANTAHIGYKTRIVFFSLLLALQCVWARAQSKSGGHAVSIGVNIPIGDFSTTHLLGFSADYSPARHGFGLTKRKPFAFTYNGGIAYYAGKKEKVSGYSYHYPAYILVHGFGGLLYHPLKKLSSTLYAGPAVGFYNGTTRFTLGSRLDITYHINNKYSLSPCLNWMKEKGSNALWSTGIRVTMVL